MDSSTVSGPVGESLRPRSETSLDAPRQLLLPRAREHEGGEIIAAPIVICVRPLDTTLCAVHLLYGAMRLYDAIVSARAPVEL